MVEEKSRSRRLMQEAARKLMLAQELERPGTTRAGEGDAYELLWEVAEEVERARRQLVYERQEKRMISDG